MESEERSAKLIKVSGLVQGVGFRPFIYRLAHQYGIKGWVENRNDGVRIHAEAVSGNLSSFISSIEIEAPAASLIRSITSERSPAKGFTEFTIKKSGDSSSEITEISPDIAVCDACLQDMKEQLLRIDYPFINCTNCGPRFTIIADLPYDREKTTMKVFPMCPDCRAEYEEILDRRFHAQPVACSQCGPHYFMHSGPDEIASIREILAEAGRQLSLGKLLAIRGLGGYHLACDALNQDASSELRKRKNREGKPFAVMFRNIEALENYLLVDDTERRELLSWQRPIVILKNKPSGPALAPAVSNGFDTTGAMLPYMPFHYLLFDHLETDALVLTSGNISDEPILIDNETARANLRGIADSFIMHNRDILNRTDDSVLMVVNSEKRMMRRSRGYVPSPVETDLYTEGVFAAGSELVNCFCIGKGKQALLSQHIGDLKNLETLEFYQEAYARFKKMFRFEPEVLAVDMHPDYLSRKFCLELAKQDPGLKITEIQHHHAHIASCMAENHLDESVIGISLDGVGYGPDGNIWGFELMSCDLAGFTRELHPEYVAQPVGDLTTKEPWRMALSYLYKSFGEEVTSLALPFLKDIGKDNLETVMLAIEKRINTPMSCSAGRLFDAVAAITGICTHSKFHAEAPMRLEQAIEKGIKATYLYVIDKDILFDDMIREIAGDILKGTDKGTISAKFHNTIIDIIVNSVKTLATQSGIKKAVLSGGSFQNRYVLSGVENGLKDNGIKVFAQKSIPSNDGGIALGQLAIASKRRSNGLI